MSDVNEQRRTLFFDPQQGWSKEETADARLKISSLWRTPEARTIVENQLYTRFDRGGWQDLGPSDEVQLSGRERGFDFECRPRNSDQGSFVEVHSTRFVDQSMKPLLEGIPLLDLELRPIKPPMAVSAFCIPASHLPDFQHRVTEQGGRIQEGQAELGVMHSRLGRLSVISSELEVLCTESRAVIEQVAEGMSTEVPSISERCTRANSLYAEAGRLARDLHDDNLVAQSEQTSLEDRARSEAYTDNSVQWMAHIERLHREHVSYETQARLRTKQSISQTLPGADFPASTARSMMVEVAEFYTEQGYDARLTNNGMVLVVGDTIIELGEKPSVRKVGSEASAEEILGQGGERGQREL